MAKYVSITERRVATVKGVTLIFHPMTPLEVHPAIEEDVIAAGIVREDLFNAAMSGQLKPADAALVDAQIRQQTLEAGVTADEPAPAEEDNFDHVAAELAQYKAAEEARAEAIALAEMEAAAATAEAEAETEKSPEFNQAVFETAVREIIAKNDPDTLTPKGAPKAAVLSELVGFEVKAIQITNFLKNLE